jgi:hypothetical protein
MINDEIKNKIIKRGIIRKEDWDKASQEHLELALLFYNLSEQFKLEGNEDVDEVVFLSETQEINDICELKNVDKVEPNKTFESESIKIGVPIKLIPLIREIYKEMKNG